MTPVAAARAGRLREIVVGARSRGEGRVGERGYRRIVFGSLGVIAAAMVMALDRGMDPFHDELWYLCGRSLTNVGSLFVPHNEHLVALHAAAYLAIAGVFGVSTSAPFLVVLLALHTAVAAAVLRLTGSLLAAAVMLFLGAGFENLMWGFQIGFVGALALALWSLVAFRGERPVMGAVLLVAAVATQGNALFVVPAIGAFLVASRRPRELLYLLPALATYGIWLFLEQSAINARGDPTTLAGIAIYATTGIVAAIGFGGGPPIAAVMAGLWFAGRPRLSPIVIAGAVGLAATFGALALVRQGFSAPESSRFLYVAAPFVLLMLASHAARPIAQRAAMSIALGIGVVLLVSNGLAWPRFVAASRAAGADIPPPGCLSR